MPLPPDRRHVRGVGFQDDGFQRQLGGQLPDARGAGPGHGPAETELEAEINEGLRLLAATVEGVGDATPDLAVAQAFKHLNDGTPHMQQYRQIEFGGNLQLFDKKLLLA